MPENPASPLTRGRKPDPKSKSGQIRELLKTGMAVADIAKKVGATAGLVYNVKSALGRTGKRGARRGPGRPRKSGAAPAGLDGIAGIVAAVQSSERDRTKLRGALERIQAVIAAALA